MFEQEKIFPLTVNELLELTTAIPENKLNCDDEIEIMVNEERACLRDLKTKQTISWIKRSRRRMKLAATG
jgi:hypothetical protein